MKRLAWWAAAPVIGLLVIGCNTQNAEPPPPKQQASSVAESPAAAPSPQKLPEGHPPITEMPSGLPQLGEEGPTISGTISVAPELADKVSPEAVLYIIARQEGLNTPVAVSRLQGVTFPAAYTLSRQHMMGSPTGPEGKVAVTARLDKDGFVGPPQPGDIEGVYPKNPVAMGETKVDFILDKLY